MNERIDRIVLAYIAKHKEPCDLIGFSRRIGVGRLYSSLKRLRRQGLIDSVAGEQIAGGACNQLYFVKEVAE
jgi:DNA-binding PadR family transcriptional regulator